MSAKPPKYDWPIKWPDEKRLTRSWLGLILFGVALLTIVPAIYVIFRFYGALTLGSSEDVRNVGLIFLAVIGAPFVIWRAIVAQGNLDRSKDRDYADLFTKAVEQLGATREVKRWDEKLDREVAEHEPNIEVRLGAIYALERISQDSERDYLAVIETLCAYVRENAPVESARRYPVCILKNQHINKVRINADGEKAWWRDFQRQLNAWIANGPMPRTDVQVAISVLGRRKLSGEYRLDLRGTNLQRANFRRGDFSSAKLAKSAMDGANFEYAELTSASFRSGTLWGANLSFSNLSECNLRGTHLDVATMREANLSGAKMRGARLRGANLRSVTAKSADFQGALLEHANLRGCISPETSFRSANLFGADMRGSNLEGADLDHADATSTNFTSANMKSVYPDKVNLSAAKLRQTVLDDRLARSVPSDE